MERIVRNSLFIFLLILVFPEAWSFPTGNSGGSTDNHYILNKFLFPPDSLNGSDTTRHINLPYNPEEESFPYTGEENTHPLFLKLPSSIKSDVEYDPVTGQYILKHKMGELDYRPPTYMSLEEYREYELDKSIQDYWDERAKAAGVGTRSGIIPSIYIGGKAFDKIFGGSTIDIRPSGSVELIFR
ncbi:MAG: hypothetical protein R2764_06650 [Bacteroidales bacterium]